jgi:hypothetical protein
MLYTENVHSTFKDKGKINEQFTIITHDVHDNPFTRDM